MPVSDPKEPVVGYLMQIPLFGDFTLRELETAATAFFPKSFPVGAPIMMEGDPNEGLAFVVSGELVSTKIVPQFGEKELSRLGPGDVIGEVSLVDGEPHAANVRVAEEARLILSQRKQLLRLFSESIDVKAKFYSVFTKTISSYLRDVNSRLTTFFPAAEAGDGESRLRDMVDRGVPQLPQRKIAEILTNFDLFGNLSPEELRLLTSVLVEMRVDRDEILFREGARGDSLYLVAEGAIRISKFFSGAGEEALTVVKPGEFFGDMALFDNKPRSATAIGNEDDTLLFAITRPTLENLLRMNVAGGCALLELLARIQCRRLRSTINTVSFWQILVGKTDDLKPQR